HRSPRLALDRNRGGIREHVRDVGPRATVPAVHIAVLCENGYFVADGARKVVIRHRDTCVSGCLRGRGGSTEVVSDGQGEDSETDEEDRFRALHGGLLDLRGWWFPSRKAPDALLNGRKVEARRIAGLGAVRSRSTA